MIDHIGTLYAPNETELSCLIKPGKVCDENQTGQQHDRLYKSGLFQNRN